jgi:hypothetical protein
MASFARSAELLKYTYPRWDAAAVEGPFLQWVDRVMMPALTHESLQRLPLANWHTSVAGVCGGGQWPAVAVLPLDKPVHASLLQRQYWGSRW